MDLKQIEIFIKVANLKSFSKAAEEIFLSQPAVSAQILSLERELDVQLINRSSKDIALTDAGEAFLNYAIDIKNVYNSALSTLSSFNDNIGGVLNLSVSTTPCNSIVPNLIKEFSENYPSVKFKIVEQSSGEIIENILKFNCELGIVGSKVNNKRIECYKLVEDEMVIISNKSLNVPSKVKIEELINYKFILRESGSATRKNFEKSLQDKGFDISRINVVCEINNLDALFKFVKAGIGIAVVSKNVCEDYSRDESIVISEVEDTKLKRSIYLAKSLKRELTPAAKVFYDFCREHFKVK